MSKQPWALILGASSGFGEATAVELARAGMNIFGVHMDRRDKLPHVAEVQERIHAAGRECEFFNMNAADDEKRKECAFQSSPGGLHHKSPGARPEVWERRLRRPKPSGKAVRPDDKLRNSHSERGPADTVRLPPPTASRS